MCTMHLSMCLPTIEESEVGLTSLTEYRTKENNYYITVQNRSWDDDMSFGS